MTLFSLFTAQANATPSNIAVIDADIKYSYKYLYENAHILAHHLYVNGAKRNELIAVLCEKGFLQVISLLGILGSGAPYLPLDEEWPLARIQQILREGLVTQLVVTKKQYQKIKQSNIVNEYVVIILDDLLLNSNYSPSYLPNQPNSDDIAYVIFTSGSTGKPKGVVISHEGACNTIEAINTQFNISSHDSILAISKLSFDLSVYDIFGMLAVGGSIVFPSDEKAKDFSHWYGLIIKHHITVWNTVPQLMQLLIDYVYYEHKNLSDLKYILLSGDWIPLSLPERIKKITNNSIIMSLGGATEGSIWSIWYEITTVENIWKSIPYGYAMPNQSIYILNDNKEDCPIDMIGEIYIGGKGVALGYWNAPDKTEKSFISHASLGKLFKTGDLGCWNRAGYVEFLGRKDDQVKLNGYRIDLGEISSKICLYPMVKEAVVLLKLIKNSNHLIAYYTSDHQLNEYEIIEYLSNYLPRYMVPYSYVRVDSFPLTENGKLDKEKLLSFESQNIRNYVTPENELEIKLCQLWSESLNTTGFGITDNFFQYGGTSLLAIQLAYKISRETGLFVKPAHIFLCPNIADFIKIIQNCESNNKINKCDIDSALLSFQQEASLKDDLINPNTSSFPIVFELLDKINFSAVKTSLISIFEEYDILRTRYQQNELGNHFQIIDNNKLTILEKNISENKLHDFFKKIYHVNIDLRTSSPFKAIIYHTENTSYLVIIIHTIAFDGWSINIFVDALEKTYLNHINDKPNFPNNDIQYKDYATWQRGQLSDIKLDKMIEYWYLKLRTYTPFHFKERKPIPPKITSSGKYIEFCLDETTSKNLRLLCNANGITLYVLLLSALYLLIYKFTKQEDLAISSMIANRPNQQCENLIGYFVNNIIIRTHIDKQKTIADFMISIHNNLVESEEYSEAPFDLVLNSLSISNVNKQRAFLPVTINVHNYRSRLTNNLLQDYLKVVPVQKNYDIAKFDTTFFIDDGQNEIKGIINYSTCLYDEAFIIKLKESYITILNNFVRLRDTPVEKLFKELSISSATDFIVSA